MTNPDMMTELRKRAEAATPGPWRKCGGFTPKYSSITAPNEYIVFGMADYKEDREGNGAAIMAPSYDQQQVNAAYIAAASPDVVLSLIQRVEALEAENARLCSAIEKLGGSEAFTLPFMRRDNAEGLEIEDVRLATGETQ